MYPTGPFDERALLLEPKLELNARRVEAVADGGLDIAVGSQTREALEACRKTLEEAASGGEIIYGMTTGFGPLAGASVDPEGIEQLQHNLIYHLATGTGEPYRRRWTRAMMVCRAACLARGRSAVRPETLDVLVQWLDERLVPAVPRYGSVGASGDLTPLAHMALAMMGEGRVLQEGESVPSAPALGRCEIEPWDPGDREALALVNGTSATAGLAALAQMRGRRALTWAVDLGAAFAECMGAHRQAYDQLVAQARPHPGQRRVIRRLVERLEDSDRLVEHPGGVQKMFKGGGRADALPQDAYSIRCIPQMLGAAVDALAYHDELVETELNSVTDNPMFDTEEGRAVHAGNFFGQHLALASDHLNQAVTTAAILAERQVARITDGDRSPFAAMLQPREPGIRSGLMGAQVTASSLIAELRSEAHPLGIQSIPTNAGNQDVNPMGTLAAVRSHQVLDRVFEVLAILGVAVRQAHFLAVDDGGEGGFSSAADELVDWLAEVVEPVVEDRPLSPEIRRLAGRLDTPGAPRE